MTKTNPFAGWDDWPECQGKCDPDNAGYPEECYCDVCDCCGRWVGAAFHNCHWFIEQREAEARFYADESKYGKDGPEHEPSPEEEAEIQKALNDSFGIDIAYARMRER